MNTTVRNLLISALYVAITVTVSGCGTLFGEQKVDYRKSSKLPPLEVPPDLTQPSADDRYVIPDSKENPGVTTLSTYPGDRKIRGQASETAGQALLPVSNKTQIERSGTHRWLAIKAPPEQVWPMVRQFWLDAGYQIKTEDVQTGILETDWIEGKVPMQEVGIRGGIQRLLGSVYSTGVRNKFRTRLERAANGDTEIYISHRMMEEVYEGEGKDRTVWQPRESDPEREAEILQKLSVKFGVDERNAQTATSNATTAGARLVAGANNTNRLLVAAPFDRAWQRVGLALDRVGFTVEDRDRSTGTYYVRHFDAGTDSSTNEKGLFSKLVFWKNDANKGADQKAHYRIRISARGEESAVEVENSNGEKEKAPTVNRILSLLLDQLK
ncbi:MAG TPA: outer membrane protein assembly factor BamC [Burkholderiales bacterium]|nr:outer membrane protein assembly factor BamC [Burkholderiales bacterium]